MQDPTPNPLTKVPTPVSIEEWHLHELLHRAYNDEKGVTAAFNLNLLQRANTELDANFQLEQFRH